MTAPLALLVLCALVVMTQLYVAIPLVPVLRQVFGADRAAAALGTAYGLSYGVGLCLFGPLSDRYGRKMFLVAGMAILAIATAALAGASSIGLVGVLRAIQGLFAASFAAAALPYVGESLPIRWRATGIGAISTAFLVAGIVGQVYGQAVAQALGWRWVFGLAAPALALVAVGLGVILVEAKADPGRRSLVQTYRALARLVVRRPLALPCAALCTVLLSFVAMYAALGPLVEGRFGLDHADVLLVRLAGLPGMALAPVAGWLAGRLGPLPVSIAGFVLAAAGLSIEAATAGILWALVIATTIFVAGVATIVPSMITLVSGRAGPLRGGALGIGGLCLFTGASCGPLISGLAGFSTLLLALAALLLLGAALVGLSATGAAPRAHRALVVDSESVRCEAGSANDSPGAR